MAKRIIFFLLALFLIACSDNSDGNSLEPESSPESSNVIVAEPETIADPTHTKSGHQITTGTSVEALPDLVIIEYDPWKMVIGSDNPSFALYNNRTVIYKTDTEYRSAILDETQYNALVEELNIVTRFEELEHTYTLSNTTDQITTMLISYSKDQPSGISVYGSLKHAQIRKKAPKPIVAIYDTALKYRPEQSKPWLPEKIEIMIWPYEYAVEDPIFWPKEWPGLNDPETVQRGESYSLYLPSEHYDELIAFLKSRNTKGAVEIAGKKWAADIRLPFPSEKSWMSDD